MYGLSLIWVQIRNNVVRPAYAQQPTILLKPPGPGNKEISLTIHDPDGKIIAELITHSQYSSSNRFTRWNLKTKSGSQVGSGVYTVVYTFGNERAFKKIIVIR